jgi:hypothetical protein
MRAQPERSGSGTIGIRLTSRTDPDTGRFLIVHPWATDNTRGGSWSNGMSGRELHSEGNLLTGFASMISGAIAIGAPLTLLIILLCA